MPGMLPGSARLPHHAADDVGRDQEHDGSNRRADEACRLAWMVEVQSLATEGADHGSADAEEDGHDDAHPVVARMERARNGEVS